LNACGAIDSIIKSIKDNTTLPGHLPALVHALTPAVQAAQGKPGDLPANAIRANVAMNVDRLKTTAPILKAAVDDNKLRVIGGVYNLKTGDASACCRTARRGVAFIGPSLLAARRLKTAAGAERLRHPRHDRIVGRFQRCRIRDDEALDHLAAV